MPISLSKTPASPPSLTDRLIGALLILITCLLILKEWHLVSSGLDYALVPAVTLVVALLATQVAPGRRFFVALAIALSLALVWRVEGWQPVLLNAFHSAGFIAAFFAALATLRSAAQQASSIRAAGNFLALQPPGRRYLALTLGGQAFALLLNYGAIALLGSLATAAAADEPDEEIRTHRTRRMLLAIQRGFVASLPWSPMSFSIAITTALIPGTSWGSVVLPAIGTSALITLTGWALDTIFKPKLSHPPAPRAAPEGSWALMAPLLILLGLLVVSVLILQSLTGLRIIALVLLVVPCMAAAWALLQKREGNPPLRERARTFAFTELPAYRGEVTLLMMAGFIGTVGAPLLAPLVKASGFHPEDLPPALVLVSFVWIIPLLGQLGMNPILAVTLIAPLVPAASELGVAPEAIVVSITAGWALGGISSPFTATTLLVGSFGNVSARHVGLRWNGSYMICMLLLLSAWVLALGYLIL
ncbi:hypothetical protein [Salipiger sp. CCB-MM3]|uniref:hypothetical protein n=1 Tax=Salipiger sp. CCB-MM3 TaxID=1792508 RepID=UPI000A9E8E1B|nr:hypothetical protein [Salipiger sp. CCB-MM3]